MSPEAWIGFATLAVTLVLAIVAVVARFIRVETRLESHEHAELDEIPMITTRLEALDERLREDRLKNTEQHKDFYDFRRETEPVLAEILQQLTTLAATTIRMESKIDDIERRTK
jgi:uncharacterized membrane protein YhiD involved in acid resistance